MFIHCDTAAPPPAPGGRGCGCQLTGFHAPAPLTLLPTGGGGMICPSPFPSISPSFRTVSLYQFFLLQYLDGFFCRGSCGVRLVNIDTPSIFFIVNEDKAKIVPSALSPAKSVK